MNTIFSKKLLAVVISSLLVGFTTNHDAFAQSSDGTGSVTNVSKQEENQTYKAKDGAYVREHFFGRYPETAALVCG